MVNNLHRRAVAAACGLVVTASGHRACCRVPSWTAHIGPAWQPYDQAPWNLYNVWWRVGQWISLHADSPVSQD